MTALTEAVARLIFAPTIALAVAFLVRAHEGPGDGFSAAIVAVVAFLLSDIGMGRGHPRFPLRPGQAVAGAVGLALGGLVMMLVVAIAPILAGRPLLTRLPQAGAPTLGTLRIDTSLAFDAGIALLVTGMALVAIRLLDPDIFPPDPT